MEQIIGIVLFVVGSFVTGFNARNYWVSVGVFLLTLGVGMLFGS